MKKIKIRSRATSNKSDHAPRATSENGSTQRQSNQPIRLGNLKKILLMKGKDGGEAETPDDQGKKVPANGLNLPPRISVNKGNPVKLKIRTNSEDPRAARCQSAQSQASGQS